MADPVRALLVNSTAALVLAAVVSRLLYESAHAVAGLVVGLTPTLTPFAVSYESDWPVEIRHRREGPVCRWTSHRSRCQGPLPTTEGNQRDPPANTHADE